jgi:hypothetical protein
MSESVFFCLLFRKIGQSEVKWTVAEHGKRGGSCVGDWPQPSVAPSTAPLELSPALHLGLNRKAGREEGY